MCAIPSASSRRLEFQIRWGTASNAFAVILSVFLFRSVGRVTVRAASLNVHRTACRGLPALPAERNGSQFISLRTSPAQKSLPGNHIVGLSSRCRVPVDIIAVSPHLKIRSVRPCNHTLWDRIHPSTADILITINVDGVVIVSAINHHIVWRSPSVEESASVDARGPVPIPLLGLFGSFTLGGEI